MTARLYIDRDRPFVSVLPEKLSDGSEVWDIHFRGGEVIHCPDEKTADKAFQLIANGLNIATGNSILIL